MRKLVQFDGNLAEPAWVAVNDDVMGGRSQGCATIVEGELHVHGTLSLANNGGFASVRARKVDFDLAKSRHVVLRVRGDGRDYQLRFATDATIDGKPVSYRATFTTMAGQWQAVQVRLDALRPVVRGTPVSGPAFDPANVREIGLVVADRREGAFCLAVDWIAVD